MSKFDFQYTKSSRQQCNQLRRAKESAPYQRHQERRADTLAYRAAKRAAQEELLV